MAQTVMNLTGVSSSLLSAKFTGNRNADMAFRN